MAPLIFIVANDTAPSVHPSGKRKGSARRCPFRFKIFCWILLVKLKSPFNPDTRRGSSLHCKRFLQLLNATSKTQSCQENPQPLAVIISYDSDKFCLWGDHPFSRSGSGTPFLAANLGIMAALHTLGRRGLPHPIFSSSSLSSHMALDTARIKCV